MMLCAACGTTKYVPVAVKVPAALTGPCEETATQLDLAAAVLEAGLPLTSPVTNSDLVEKIRALRVDLATCSAEKAEIRDWEPEVDQ